MNDLAKVIKIVVSGRVQGVGFRAATLRKALRLGLKGYVTNLASGQVEVVAGGPAAALDELVAWCRSGPTFAKVTDVVVAAAVTEAFEELHDFSIR